MQELFNENELLRDELNQIRAWDRNKREVLEPIYLSAAKKLERYYPDRSEICGKLAKLFGPEHERDLRRYLPEHYKRTYVIDETRDMPRNPQEEALKLMSDILTDMLAAVSTLYRKIRDEPKDSEKHKALCEIILHQFGGFAELEKIIESWKNLSVELAYLKELQDERQKIGDYEKIMLKIQLLFINKDHVAKMIGFSSKWIKNGVEKDIDIQRSLETIRKCPFCLKDIADWYNQQKIRSEKGLPLETPPILR